LLGNTLTAIAREKAGIIKPGVPVVIGEAEGEVREVFEGERRKAEGEKFVFVQDEKPILSSRLMPSGYWKFETKDYSEIIDELGGFAQEKNAATVLCAIDILNTFTLHLLPFALSEAVRKGFKNVIENTGLMGRWQVAGQHPKIVLDTGHNAGGIEYIVRQLQSEKYDRLHIVFGMVKDKDISVVLALLPQNALYYFTQASIPRALDANLLAEQAAKFSLKGKIYSTVNEAFSAAKHQAAKKDFIFVGGSTFVVAEALPLIDS
jgi:dihydrofolate synthase/folylpolyglutamate synthase